MVSDLNKYYGKILLLFGLTLIINKEISILKVIELF